LKKSYYKTASLIANSCKSVGVLSGVSEDLIEQFYNYGRHLGLAFQIVDDVLDFTGTDEVLGKPAGSDLKSGNLTAPALYAMENAPYLVTLVEREFREAGDFEEAFALVQNSNGIERTRQLAKEHAQAAHSCLVDLPESESKEALEEITDYVLRRLY
ncbi:MAG: polyprenyl synthetase family protein, partial [Cyanobacteria bacterium J06632_22]